MFTFIKNLFQKQSGASLDVKTTPLSREHLQRFERSVTQYSPHQLIVGSGQSVGKQRDHNEDSLFSMHSVLSDGELDLPFGIFMIADGMGGHQHGEIASSMAARTMAEHLVKEVYQHVVSPNKTPIESLHEIMDEGVRKAQQAVVKLAPGGGTTLTVALVLGERITLAHVGDSRAYLIKGDGSLQAVTKDHSLVGRLIELGQITEEEAAVHPQRNELYRALGQAEPFEPDLDIQTFPRPGHLMICSDGLWGVVPEDEMRRIILNSPSLPDACQQLTAAANDAGGPDNISVILVQYLE
ncbi:MAG: protein phosphatase 2C domain-containing protein [Anaerolineaceae bacterium]|nr:protein phosphatase 2C domain-containing protein [Anaerolineaceae bacterium]